MNVGRQDGERFFSTPVSKLPTAKKKNISTAMSDEPLLKEDSRTFSLFPLKYPEIWNAYKKICTTFWTAEEVDLEMDKRDFETKLTQGEKHYLCTVLAFFSSADSIVNLNLLNNFCSEIKVRKQGLCWPSRPRKRTSTPKSTPCSSTACATRTRGTCLKGKWTTTGCLRATRKGSTRTVPN